ncbi:uncharacterized protein [Nicotiana tomentosiformis]|uniref:uncharacterized protein n=1 Tax=Nicotiana tomentosiformis TaxID=4098 RepID=UPI00388CE33D
MVRAAASEEWQLRFARFKRYNPYTFSGLASWSEHGFLEEFHNILRTMDIVETSGVDFTTFQLKGAAYQWWRLYEMGSPAELASLTWVQFLEMFLREFVPQSRRDAWRAEFEQLRQGTMSVLEYAMRFDDLAGHAPALVSTVRERVRRFIEGLMHDIWFSMACELESDVSFKQVVGIARRVEDMWGHEREYMQDQEREDREVGKPRRLERSTGPYFGGRVRHDRGFMGHPVRFALQASHSVSGAHGSQSTHTTQFLQPHQQRGFFKCGDTNHKIEVVRSQERGEMEAKRPRGSGSFGGIPSGGQSYHNRGRPYRPAQTTHPAHRDASASHGSYSAHSGQSSSSALLTQSSHHASSVQASTGNSSGYQEQQFRQRRGCFECGKFDHYKRDCPRLLSGDPQ